MVLKEKKKYNAIMTFGREVNGFCLKKGKREHRPKINNISLAILHACILNTELQP